MSLEKEQELIKCANTSCQQLKRPGAEFLRHPATKERVCRACWQYYYNKGKDREVKRRNEQHETNCGNTLCKILLLPGKIAAHPVTKERICINCCAYYKKYGRDREVVAGKLKKFTEPKARESCANTFCKQQYYPKDLRPHPVTKKKICL
ncbi:hypothetical protein GCK72_021532 [Caenorhabditis remanei]|uniref:Uncharacterized protein n=1 Tax=Caenorhabditis remanei TaxID=31234 RepID=A0A6A5GK32_CAERE|nr:hypothetical protein GCK72_021532 [Caenorhabditis remanei]KAF1754966.1 hypothetical protein GCK72_021532 [Caenorhabditis remanei]